MAERKNRRPGLRQRSGRWYIDKKMKIEGERVHLSGATGTADYAEAERVLDRWIEEKRREIRGERVEFLWDEARDRYLRESHHLDSFGDIQRHLSHVDPYLHGTPLHRVCDENLEGFIAARKAQGVKNSTVNRSLEQVRRIVRLAHLKWRDPVSGRPWLESPAQIGLLPQDDARPAHPLSWLEQDVLFPLLPDWQACIALFMVNAGPRPGEVVQLRWSWERRLGPVSVFVLPAEITKENKARLLIPNHVGQRILEAQRGAHPERVFTGGRGGPVSRLNGHAWDSAREQAAERYEERTGAPCPAGLASLHWHDLRHTFGRRLRAAGVGLETRKDLLGHENGDQTTHYSQGEVRELYEAACKAAERENESVALSVVTASA